MELTLEAFATTVRHLPREEFLARVVDPHLLVTRAPRPSRSESATFSTMSILPMRATPRSDDPPLLPVRKRPGSNPFGLMITIGRAANNDIVLADSSVSKLHCYVHSYGGPFHICDPGSTNGTFVDGVRAREAGLPLRSGSVVRLGDAYEAVFLLPADLHGLVTDRRRIPTVKPVSSVG